MINIVELQERIKKFGNQVEEFNETSQNGGTLWQMKNEIADYLRAAVFPSINEKEAIVAELESHAEKLRLKQASMVPLKNEVADEAEVLIENLRITIEDGFYAKLPNKESVSQLKVTIDEIYNCFKNGAWPNKQRRANAWENFSAIKNRIKEEEDKYFVAIREKRSEHSKQSQLIAEELIAIVQTAHPDVAIEPLIDLQSKVGTYLVQFGFTEEALNWLLIIPSDFAQKPLKAKSEIIRGVRKFVIDHKESMIWEDKQRIFDTIDLVSEAMDAAWEQQRIESQKKKEEWEERKKMQAIKQQEREQKQKEWEAKQKAFLKVLTDKLEKRLQDKKTLEQIIQAKKEYISRMEGRITNHQAYLKTCEDDVLDIEDKLQTAWTVDFRDKMVEKLAKRKEKISSIKTEMETFKKNIQSATKDQEQLSIKLTYVDKSIDEIQAKQAEVTKIIEEF